MEIEFKRDALYEEVWRTPLTKLAQKYGLSDNGLRKICNAMNIPLPRGGHWAKVAAGHQVPQPPLPAEAERTTFHSHPPTKNHPWRTPEDDKWLAHRLEFERRPDQVISGTAPPSKWHPLVAQLGKRLQEMQQQTERWRQISGRRPDRRRPEIDMESWRWNAFLHKGQVLMHAPLKVTVLGQQRALRIVNALCHAAEARDASRAAGADPRAAAAVARAQD